MRGLAPLVRSKSWFRVIMDPKARIVHVGAAGPTSTVTLFFRKRKRLFFSYWPHREFSFSSLPCSQVWPSGGREPWRPHQQDLSVHPEFSSPGSSSTQGHDEEGPGELWAREPHATDPYSFLWEVTLTCYVTRNTLQYVKPVSPGACAPSWLIHRSKRCVWSKIRLTAGCTRKQYAKTARSRCEETQTVSGLRIQYMEYISLWSSHIKGFRQINGSHTNNTFFHVGCVQLLSDF